PVRALAGARHHLPGGEAALRGAARRVGRRALARAREHTRAPREPVRGQGARRGVDPGFPPRRGGARRSGATMTDERRWLDRLCERATRALARRTSRRSFLTRLGTALAGTAALPLLPMARAATESRPPVPDDAALHGRCTRTEGERPLYLTMKNSGLLWCFGTQSRAVNCSVAVVLGVATRT